MENEWFDNLRLPAPGLIEAVALNEGLSKAITEYESNAERGVANGPYLVVRGVEASVFEAWSAEQENCWRVCFIQKNVDELGDVYLFGDSSLIHNFVSQKIILALLSQVGKRVESYDHVLEGVGSTRYTIKLPNGALISKESDGAFVPATQLDSFPTLALEVACNNESLDILKKEVLWWAYGGAETSMGIKIDSNPVKRFTFLIVRSAYQVEEIEFAPDCVTGPNQKVIRIDIAQITRGQVIPPELINFTLTLDLYIVQKWILKALQALETPRADVCFCKQKLIDDADVVFCSKNTQCPKLTFHRGCINMPEEEKAASLAADPCLTTWICPWCR